MARTANRRDDDGGPSLLELGTDSTGTIDETGGVELEGDIMAGLSAEQRSILARNKIRRTVLDRGKDGITAPEISALTGLDEKVVNRHIDTLCRLREVYRVKRARNVIFYYPNGTPLHRVKKRRVEIPNLNMVLEISLAQGRDDQLFFHVLEKRSSLLEGEITEGAVTIPLDSLVELNATLQELAREVQQ